VAEHIARRWTSFPQAVAVFVTIFLVLAGFSLSVDLPRTKLGFQGDEATYYSLGHSLATDLDFAFERQDLVRIWEEFPGPEGIFLKRAKTVDLQRSEGFPYFRVVRTPDLGQDRLYYGKSYVYPLIAAPFVRAFGTNGFLVLHAALVTLNILAAYTFLRARPPTQGLRRASRTSPGIALAYAAVFFGASVVPVYFVSLTPELLNVSLVLYAFCVWSLKETAAESPPSGGWLSGPRPDYLAAALLGVATFSKPSHALLLFPLLAVAGRRRQWRRAAAIAAVFALTTGGLFAGNAALTGEFNYQGGHRKSFYSHTGFPFANERERFDSIGIGLATDTVRIDIIATSHSPRVFLHNLAYFTIGRYGGLLPYFFPAVLSVLLFLARPRERRGWQWVIAATAFGSAAALLLYMPYTYSGAGGSVGNRYFMSFYPLFLFLTPPLSSARAPLAAILGGGLFTAKMVLTPFHTTFFPSDHARSGPLRLLPVERTLVNDLMVTGDERRARVPLGGTPPVAAYFLDANAFNPEGTAFWVKGRTRADVILRAPAGGSPGGNVAPLRIAALDVDVLNGGMPSSVTLTTGGDRTVLHLEAGAAQTVRLKPGYGVPYQPPSQPTNWMYALSITTTAGFIPLLEVPGATDNRLLGAMITIRPVYGD
jgi:hypothetical protein